MLHGLLIDNASAPEFIKSSEELMLKFVSSEFGRTNYGNHDPTLQVKIAALNDSSHCDKHIIPLIVPLNLVAIACFTKIESFFVHYDNMIFY